MADFKLLHGITQHWVGPRCAGSTPEAGKSPPQHTSGRVRAGMGPQVLVSKFVHRKEGKNVLDVKIWGMFESAPSWWIHCVWDTSGFAWRLLKCLCSECFWAPVSLSPSKWLDGPTSPFLPLVFLGRVYCILLLSTQEQTFNKPFL